MLWLWLNIAWGTLLGLGFVAGGIRLWNRKPVVLAPRTFTILLSAVFVPVLVIGVFACFSAAREGDPRLLLPLIFPVAMLVLVIGFFRKIIGRAVVMNVNENTLYDALEHVLDRHGMSYDEQRSTLDIADRDATIDVNYQATTNSGSVNTRGDDQRALFPVLEDLRDALQDKKLQRRSRLAPWYVALGALMTVTQLGLLSVRMLNGG